MKKLSHIYHWDKLYIGLFAVILFGFGLIYHWLFLVGLCYCLIYRKSMYMLGVIILMIFVFIRFYGWKVLEPPPFVHGHAYITNIEHLTYHDRLTVTVDWIDLHVYAKKESFQVGQSIILKGEVQQYQKNTRPDGFNSYHYYLSQNIKGYLEFAEISVIKDQNITVLPREKLNFYISTFESDIYLKSLILGIYEFPQETKQLYQGLGIWFLLSFSGIHLYAIINIIKKMMFYINISSNKQQIIIILIYLLLLYLQQGSWVVWRLLLLYGLGQINYYKNLNLSQLERVFIVWIILILFKVHLLYHIGFLIVLIILSFLALFKNRMSHYPFVTKGYYRSFLITAICIPFIGYISFPILFLIPFIITFFSFIIMPFAFIVLWFKPLEHYFHQTITYFETFLTYIYDQSYDIVFPKVSLVLAFFYLICLIFLIALPKIKHKIFFLILCLFFICVPFLSLRFDAGYVMFLDVGQGDTTIIVQNSCVIVIDAYDNVLDYLNDQGISHISYLVLTHNHDDHVKEAPSLIQKLNVEHVIINPYDTYAIHHPSIKTLSSGDDFGCGSLRFYVLGPIKEHPNENNNSLVIIFSFEGKTFLMTGDIEYDAEMDLVERYGHRLKSDVLKVGHHGSNTSSHARFLSYVQPEVAIISVKSKNRHQFPHLEVIERLQDHKTIIYQTNQMGSIIYKRKDKKEKWEFYLPF